MTNIIKKSGLLGMLFALLFIEPVVLFGLTGGIVPQLSYFGGILSVIVILTAIIFNEPIIIIIKPL